MRYNSTRIKNFINRQKTGSRVVNNLVVSQGTLILEAIENRLLKGDNIAQACAFINLDPIEVQKLRLKDEAFDAAIRAIQSIELENGVDRLAELHDEIDDALLHRSVSDNIKWLATKRSRKHYGEKLDVTVEHKIDLKTAMQLARERSGPLIEHKPLNVIDFDTDSISVDSIPGPKLDVFD